MVNRMLRHDHLFLMDHNGNQYEVAITRFPLHYYFHAININQLDP